MTAPPRFTIADLELLPLPDGRRYEIIDGELHVTTQPSWEHQLTCGNLFAALSAWTKQTGAGHVNLAPGIIFAEDQAVAPDLVWISRPRLQDGLRGGHLYVAPELVVEVLSPGASNERRDRELKLALYSHRGVDEYWICDWRARTIDVFRRSGEVLVHMTMLGPEDALSSPLLPGFSVAVGRLFA